MSKCLVTGHKGYIGSQVYAKLKEMGHDVLGIDLLEEIPKDILFYLKDAILKLNADKGISADQADSIINNRTPEVDSEVGMDALALAYAALESGESGKIIKIEVGD